MNCTHNNCFTCPYPDCISASSRVKPRETDKVDWSDRGQVREYKRTYAKAHRLAKLQAEFPHLSFN